jgi:hypothetical protein
MFYITRRTTCYWGRRQVPMTICFARASSVPDSLVPPPSRQRETLIAELAMLRMKRIYSDGICVYIAPLKSLARERLKEWRLRLGSAPLLWRVLELSGDTHYDRSVLRRADLLVCTPEKWDLISRGWLGRSGDHASDSNSSVKSEELCWKQLSVGRDSSPGTSRNPGHTTRMRRLVLLACQLIWPIPLIWRIGSVKTPGSLTFGPVFALCPVLCTCKDSRGSITVHEWLP